LYHKILEPPPIAEQPEEKPSMLDNLRGLTQRIRLPFRRRQTEPSPDLSLTEKMEELTD
jgi:hypothetical protein